MRRTHLDLQVCDVDDLDDAPRCAPDPPSAAASDRRHLLHRVLRAAYAEDPRLGPVPAATCNGDAWKDSGGEGEPSQKSSEFTPVPEVDHDVAAAQGDEHLVVGTSVRIQRISSVCIVSHSWTDRDTHVMASTGEPWANFFLLFPLAQSEKTCT